MNEAHKGDSQRGRDARVAVGSRESWFPCQLCIPRSSHIIFPGLSFLSSKLKDLRDRLPTLTFHGSNSRGGRSLCMTTYNPHDVTTFSSYSKIDGSGERTLEVSDP